ncbi:MAG: transcription antitermination factor NusB [Atopobiaceae bacterium]
MSKQQKRQFKGRTLARSQALQLIFQAEATGRAVDEVLDGDYALSEGPLDPFGELLARGTWSLRPGLDRIIDSVSTNWSLYRMPAVDRNLLRLALYEILEVDEVELPVTIDECVELAKAYGTDESSRFVNGVLGKIARELEAGRDLKREAEEGTEEAEALAAAAPEEAPSEDEREWPAYGADIRAEEEAEGAEEGTWQPDEGIAGAEDEDEPGEDA